MSDEAAVSRTQPTSSKAGSRRRARGGPLAGLRARFALPGELLWRRLLFAAKAPYHRSGLYRWRLTGPAPVRLACQPGDPWPGQAAIGQAILQNRFTFAGRTLADPSPLWHPRGADPAWLAGLHGFDWLRDLRVLGGDTARRRARELVGDWIERHPGPGGAAWEPATVGRRLAAWLGQYEFHAGSAEVTFKSRLLDMSARQARHLERVLPAGLCGAELIAAAKGLIVAGCCLPDGEPWLNRGLTILERELPRQVLADGGHLERSPSVHLRVLRDLIDVRSALAAAGYEPPRGLQLAIEGMTPFLKLLQHADGGLALFNDSVEEQAVFLEMSLQRAQSRTRAQFAAPQSGFQRLQAGRTLVLVDAGAPPPPGYDRTAHAGTLAFEMSHGRQRVIVNCGAHPGHPDWHQVLRGTPAHSTLTLADTNSSELREGAGARVMALGRRPETVVCRREENDGATWLDMSHDGYRTNLDALIERRLFLAANGEDLRGEDLVNGPGGLPFAIRFHLHPDVTAGLVQGGSAVLLRLANGVGFRLRAAGAAIDLEESVYLGHPEEIRRGQQIVLTGTTHEGRTQVKWALKREAAKR